MTILQSSIVPSSGYQIERSLRFNSADSAYLSKTFSTNGTGGGITVTFSAWVKRGTLGSFQSIIGADSTAGTSVYFAFNSSNNLEFGQGATIYRVTNGVFRDPSAWYHVVLVWDSSNATDSLRCRIYVNGTLQTYSTSTSITLNTAQALGYARAQGLGADTPTTGARNYFNGYLTEINFIDGQALTPSSFGETDASTGVWKPKRYTGTYGTNGFFLKFADNSGTTSTTLGKDSSGNGNNWTPNNFSVTAGAGNDSLVDTPTPYGSDTGAGGEVRGNYATLNPLTASEVTPTYSEGNLKATVASGNMQVIGTMQMNGKNYIEWTALSNNGAIVFSPDQNVGIAQYYNLTNRGIIDNNGTSYVAGSVSFTVNSGSLFSWTTNDIVGVAYDTSNGALTLTKNGGSTVSITVNGMSAAQVFPVYVNRTSASGTTVLLNAGQRPFAYTAPSGFKALCTQNLPTPTIGATSTTQANDYFNAILYTGTGASASFTGVGFQPDFTWIKSRSAAQTHGLFDSNRGVQKLLQSNSTAAEITSSNYLTSFDSDGFSIGSGTQFLNGSGDTFVAWNWKANGAGVTNTSGTITSTVSANTTSGFSIVTYTGTGANATVGHGLGVAPKFIIVKERSPGGDNWVCWHSGLTSASYYIELNTTAAQNGPGTAAWNSTAPTSTVFSLGTGIGVNQSTATYVAYCFAEVAGYSKFGSYTGNGSTDGPFVFTNFRPRYVLIKNSTSVGSYDWEVYDSARDTYNMTGNRLFPDLSNAESNNTALDFLSNGFKIRQTTGGDLNATGATHIYAAFAESPFKYALAR